ncbi:MAG: hypothetical protein HQL76_05725 [Magnetococcales bacterium]|nr:hypothetical protein [Magnetococcales bacterium]
MDLSLSEAAIVLGKTPRQIRYLIKSGTLKAKKEKGCWVIEEGSLPLSDSQRQTLARRATTAREAMAEATAPVEKVMAREPVATEKGVASREKEKEKKTYSVTDLRAFALGEELFRAVERHLGGEDPAKMCLFEAMKMLCRGCHAFQPPQKEARFTEAREAAADAVTFLLLTGEANDAMRKDLARRIEAELIPKLAALAASQEKRSRKKRHEGLTGFFPGSFGQ